MTEQEIKTGLQRIIDETKAINSYIENDNLLIQTINSLNQSNRQKLYNYYTSRESGFIADVREFVAQKLINGIVTLEEVTKKINEQKEKKPAAFRSYKKLYSILYPFITAEHADIRQFLDSFLRQLIGDLGLSTDAKKTYFDFQGARQQGSNRLWFAIYNKSRADQSVSKQIFGDFQDGKFSYGLYIHKTKESFDRIYIDDTKNFSYSTMLHQLKKAAQEIKEDVGSNTGVRIFTLTNQKLFKISHGSFKGASESETLEEFKKRKWIVLHETTGYGHTGGDGDIFKTEISIGDLVYITIGGNYLFNIARVVSDWDYIPQEIVNNEDGWLFREVEYIQEPVVSTLSNLKEHRTKTYPSYTYPLAYIGDELLNEMNETLFIPNYNIQFVRSIPKSPENSHMPQLNTILYGPPGTGKTYNTIIKAAKIITGKDLEYNEAKAVFEPLLGDQVEFITFHQNYSYEDFVVGLRPKLHGSHLAFEKNEGVFYKICDKARNNYKAWKEGLEATEPEFENVLYEYLKPLQTAGNEIEVKLDIGNKNYFITGSGGDMLQYRTESKIAESLNVETLKALYVKNESPKDSHHTYYTPLVKALKLTAEKLKKEAVKVELKNYVLIIDEINRANISRVFGELITLLEKDKRLGNKHQMLVSLPNGERFSVPKNLYVLGTMNTADKSIALIDIALRRRFVFENMYPRPELVDKLVKEPYNEFLKTLNVAILEKKGADFLIGHSYLMAEDGEELDFVSVMNQKVIPLLNEYFYSNRDKAMMYDLLKPAMEKVPSFNIEKDNYIGVICKRS